MSSRDSADSQDERQEESSEPSRWGVKYIKPLDRDFDESPCFLRRRHDDEAAGGRVGHEIARHGNGPDQPSDQPDRLDVGMNSGIGLLDPSVRHNARPPATHAPLPG
jgi:hypothetical protein